MEQPSKYHDMYFTGRTTDGYEWSWNSAHEDLEPSKTFTIGGENYCSYCCDKAKPIQAGLRRSLQPFQDLDFSVTGYTCICDGAEKEKELRKELIELNKKHRVEEQELKNKYANILKQDKKQRLKMEYEYNLKKIEREEKYQFR